MSKYRMEDNKVVDTEKASQHWTEARFFNGSNMISKATGSQWEHETLYRSAKGNYYLEHDSQVQGSQSRAEWIDPADAAKWLLLNDHDLPEDLAKFAEEVSE